MTQRTTLSIGTKLGYGVGSIGEGLAYNAFYLYFIYFLTDYVGIDPVVAGSISLFNNSYISFLYHIYIFFG